MQRFTTYSYFIILFSFILPQSLKAQTTILPIGYKLDLDQPTGDLSISGDGNLVSASNSGTVRVYAQNGLVWEAHGNDLAGTNGKLSSDGSRLALNSPATNATKVFSWDSTSSSWLPLASDIPETFVDFAYGGEHLITQSGTSTYKIYQFINGSWIQKGVEFNATNSKTIAISSDGNTVITELNNLINVHYWNNNTWQLKGQVIANNDNIKSLAISTDGNTFVLGKYNTYNGSTSGGMVVYEWNGSYWWYTFYDWHQEEYSSLGENIALSEDGTTIAICDSNHAGEIINYDFYTRGRILIYKKNESNTWDLIVSQEGKFRGNAWGQQVALSSNGNRFIARTKSSIPNQSIPYKHANVFEIIPSLDCSNIINTSNFENDWGIWDSNSYLCSRSSAYAYSTHVNGNYCIEVNNSANEESFTTQNINLSNHSHISISFIISKVSLSIDDEVLFEISYDGGLNFQTIRYSVGEDINRISSSLSPTKHSEFIIPGPFTSTTKFRFRIAGTNLSDLITIDDITIKSCPPIHTCNDNIMNGNETGIDCGGSCNSCDEIFVDQNNPSGNNNGTSWQHAFTNLQDALALGAGKTIHIAEGIYKPSSGTDRGTFFNLSDNVHIIGGYASGGSTRDPSLYPTILSGDIDGDGIPTLNSFHLISINNVDNVEIEGITIQDGNADDASSFARSRGGGIYSAGSTFSLRNVVFQNNNAVYGGGLFFKTSNETKIDNCSFFNNSAQDGSAIYSNNQSSAYISRSRIQNNTASNRAAIEINNSSYTSIDNTLIVGNTSTNENALALIATNKNQVFNIYNSTIIGNLTDQDLVLMETDGSNSLDANYYNTIIAHNDMDVQGSVNILDGGLINFNTEHCYLQETPVIGNHSNNFYTDAGQILNLNSDYKVTSETSSIVNTGNNTHALQFPKDLEGNDRIRYIVDIGAFESSFGPLEIYVDETATGTASGDSWINAFTDLQDALASGLTNDRRVVYIAEGTYYPTASNTTGSRGISFDIPNNTTLLGGYPAGGGNRNHGLYASILSGNIDGVSSYSGNSYHVVKLTDVSDVIFDGIIIRDGNANDPSSFGRARGGGLYLKNAELTLNNVEVKWNKAIYGGGLYARQSQDIHIENSTFKKNTADYGSALYHSQSSVLYIQNSKIYNNTANNRCAIEANNATFTEINNSLIANNASANANAIGFIATNRDQTCNIYNSTILGANSDKNLLTMQIGFGDQLDLNIQNSILAHQNINFSNNVIAFNNGVLNLNTDYCYIQGASIIGNSNNNLYSDSSGDLLLNGDYSPTPCSPVVNAGNDALTISSLDIDKNNRFYNTVDIGAFESQADCNNPREAQVDLEQEPFLYFHPNPTNGILYFQSNMEIYSISISDMLGKRMLSSENPTQLDIKDFPSGIYILNVIRKGKVIQVEKIVKH